MDEQLIRISCTLDHIQLRDSAHKLRTDSLLQIGLQRSSRKRESDHDNSRAQEQLSRRWIITRLRTSTRSFTYTRLHLLRIKYIPLFAFLFNNLSIGHASLALEYVEADRAPEKMLLTKPCHPRTRAYSGGRY